MAGLSSAEVDEESCHSHGTQTNRGMSIVMIEHIMRAVMRFSTVLLSSMAGRTIAEGTPEEILHNPRWRKPTFANRLVLTDVEAGYGAVRVLHRVSVE